MAKYIKILLTFFFLQILFTNKIYALEHPGLLVTNSDITSIRSKTINPGPVKLALETMKSQNFINDPDHWQRDFIDKSFNYLIANDSNTKTQALSVYDKYTNINRFGFQTDPDDKNYTVARQCAALPLGYDFLYPVLSDTQKQRGLDLLNEWGNGLYNKYSTKAFQAGANFHTGMFGCLGLIGLVTDNDTWINFAKDNLKTHFFDQTYNPEGDFWEGNFYQYYSSGNAVIFLAAYEKVKGNFFIANSGITNVWEYYTYALMNDKTMANFGDNHGTILKGEMFYFLNKKKLAGDLKIPGYLWVWQQIRGLGADELDYAYLWNDFDHLGMILWYPTDTQTQNPSNISAFPSMKSFPSNFSDPQGYTSNPGGMISLRSGWTDNDLSIWLINRWRWQSHMHFDPNHFLLSAFGEKLISYENNRNYDDPLRGKISQQNTILINKDYGNWRDIPRGNFTTGSNSSLGYFYNMFSNELVSVVTSDSKYPHSYYEGATFANSFFGNATTANIIPISKAERTIMILNNFLSTPFALVLDNFQKTGASQYTWQAYLPAGLAKSGSGTTADPFIARGSKALLKIIFMLPNSFTLGLLPKDTARNDQALQITQDNTSKGDFLTLLLPEKTTAPANYLITELNPSNPKVYSVNSPDSINKIIYNDTGTTVISNGIETDAKIAIVSYRGSNPDKYFIFQGTTLKINGETKPVQNGIYANSLLNPLENLTPTPSPTGPTVTPSPTTILTPSDTPIPTAILTPTPTIILKQWSPCMKVYSDGTNIPTVACLEDIFAQILKVFLSLIVMALFIILIKGGFTYLTAGDNFEQATKAKKTLTYAVIGIAAIAMAFIIFLMVKQFTGVDVTKFSTEELPPLPSPIPTTH